MIRPSQIAHVLKFLNVENPAPILKQGRKWVALPAASDYCLDAERVQFLTEQREEEWRQIEDYVSYAGCRMSFLANALDDTSCEDCGRCANCDPKRDIELVNGPLDILDHAAPQLGAGGKIGYDATATSLHIGNLVQILTQRRLQLAQRIILAVAVGV